MKARRKPSNSYRKIWSVVEIIPKGKVATYGQIARVCKLPGQARLVGYALHNLPHGLEVPWWRVINAHGRISLPVNSHSWKRQRTLLEKEGVAFVQGKINLTDYGWKK